MRAPEQLLHAFPPVGLDELVGRAALLRRRDRKYLLRAADLPALLRGLGPDVRALQIDGRREFEYQSVYFDTSTLDCYLAAAHRRRRRYKVRVRSYLPAGSRYLEVKTRRAHGVTMKHRFPYGGPADDVELDPHAYAEVDTVLVREGCPARPRVPLDRVLVTNYRRATLFDPATEARVTVDTDLRWALPGGPGLRTPSLVIVETKSPGSAAGAVDRLLWSQHHRPCALSKFGVGLALLRPELPANRWSPVLRQHLFPDATDRSS